MKKKGFMKKLEDLVVMEGYMIDYWREKLKVGNSTVFFFSLVCFSLLFT